MILYYQLGDRIHDTIAALQNQQRAPDSIVLVDNASYDGVLDDAERRYPACRVLRMPRNSGYAAGMNAGASALAERFDYVLFLTHEVVMDSDCTARLISVLRERERVGMVGPKLRLLDTDITWSVGGWITRFGDVRHNLDESRASEVHWLDGACLLMRTSIFLDIGGFDEDYFLYWEDVDVSIDIRIRSGIACVPEAIAYQGTAKTPIYFRTRNQILCWHKHRQPWRVGYAIVHAVIKAAAVDLGGRAPAQAKARLVGVMDGLTGRLTSSPISMVREK
ncbi:Glycosyl transferase, family 2 [Rhodococcus wratislaviensis]|uniref:Glycosyl transferase, family 2 n=1 Tax=Rhodococcus wratislaviensis TaxID=44752 RepID=A0A402BYJ0_RHOWR|nr:glycosyltransferase family 2 protein [Rhodococcus wratislaviensis]GCE36402.1 Glycosyl transferase, family 2 [Rhodococcus wratislaviensis]